MDKTLERIIELMEQGNIQDQEMIAYLGLPRGTFSNWKRDKGKSYYEYIDRIADKLNVTIDYLIRGEDPVESSFLTKEELEHIMLLRRMTPERRTFVHQATRYAAYSN